MNAQCTCTCNAINFSFSLSSRQSEYLEIVSLTLGPWMMVEQLFSDGHKRGPTSSPSLRRRRFQKYPSKKGGGGKCGGVGGGDERRKRRRKMSRIGKRRGAPVGTRARRKHQTRREEKKRM